MPIEIDAVRAQLHDRDVVRVVGAQAGRVPGRARGQLVLFDQYHVGPAEAGQVINQRGAHRPAADNRNAARDLS